MAPSSSATTSWWTHPLSSNPRHRIRATISEKHVRSPIACQRIEKLAAVVRSSLAVILTLAAVFVGAATFATASDDLRTAIDASDAARMDRGWIASLARSIESLQTFPFELSRNEQMLGVRVRAQILRVESLLQLSLRHEARLAALELLRTNRGAFPATEEMSQPARDEITRALRSLRSEGVVPLRVICDECQVVVNERSSSHFEQLLPGPYRVSIRGRDGQEWRTPVSLTAERDVTLNYERRSITDRRQGDPETRPMWPPVVGLTAGAAMTGAGAVMLSIPTDFRRTYPDGDYDTLALRTPGAVVLSAGVALVVTGVVWAIRSARR